MKKILIYLSLFLILLAPAFAQSEYIHLKGDNSTTNDGDDDATLSWAGGSSYRAGVVGSAFDCNDANYLTSSNFAPQSENFDNSDDFSICMWVLIDVYTANEVYLQFRDGVTGADPSFRLTATDMRMYWDNGWEKYIYNGTTSTGTWYWICAIHNASQDNFYGYVNNAYVNFANDDGAQPYAVSDTLDIGICGRTDGNNLANGGIDDVRLYNFSLSKAQMDYIYNGGAGTQNSISLMGGGAPAPTLTPTITDIDPEGEDTNTTINLSLVWTNYNITGSAAALVYNGSYYSASLTGSNYALNGSANYSATLTTPIISINNSAVTYFWSYNVTNVTTDLLFNTSSTTQNLTWTHPRLNITRVYNAYTQANLTNFTGNVTKGSWSSLFNVTTGSAFIPLTNGTGNYTIYVEANGYAISNSTNYQNLEITDTTNLSIRTAQFGLYSNNSVLVYVFDEDTNNLITNNVTLTVTGNSTETIYNFVNGTTLITNLPDGSYSFKFQAINYTLRTYSVTVAQRSFQSLTAYLTPSNYLVTLTFLDYDSSQELEDVSITMSRLINSSWVIIESKSSDITGRAQFSYVSGILYRFYASKTGYTSKTFDLDPILFSEYNVRLERITTQEETIDYQKVYIDFSPKYYFNDAQNNFTIFFASPEGFFESYNFTIKYPGGSLSGSGSNAVGENFAGDVNISGANFFDTVNVTYTYDISIGDPRTYSFKYYIDGGAQGNNTMIDNKDKTYGMGIFERVLIVTGIVVVISGIVAMFLGSIPALAVAIIFMGIFTGIGFYPIWLFLISALVGVILIIKAGS